MEDAGQLSLKHPYTETPGTKQFCSWTTCFCIGALVGLFCINPDAGGCRAYPECMRGARVCKGGACTGCRGDTEAGRLHDAHQHVTCPAACLPSSLVPLGSFSPHVTAGDYGVWERECVQFVNRWAPGFAQAGCALTLQRHRCVKQRRSRGFGAAGLVHAGCISACT